MKWVVIENADTWKVNIPKLNPASIRYQQIWREYYRLCIEGLWGKDFSGYRFMPPKLFYYINFYTMVTLSEDKKQKISSKTRPRLRDLDWEIFYMFFVAKGFSGFEDDDEFSCNEDIISYRKGELTKDDLDHTCINSNGDVKGFIEPLEYCKMLHDYPKGRPIYGNKVKNVMLFGSRSSGKSYAISAILLHEIIFDGNLENKKISESQNKTALCIGSKQSDKSSNFFQYMTTAMNEYAINEDLGVWSDIGKEEYEPSPLFRQMVGETKPNNARALWRNEYEVRDEYGRKAIKGTGAFAKHVNYKDNSEAAASGRYNYNVIEEIGLMEDAPVSWESNEFTTQRDGVKFGSNVGLGTSGDIEKVEGAKEIFLKPFTYNCVAYKDEEEGNGENGYTGLFIPRYMIDMYFKDKNGNTNIELAKSYYQEELEKVKNNPVAYRARCMHAPLVVSHMWINSEGKLLPVEEARLREKELLKGNLYATIGTPAKLIWDSETLGGVRMEADSLLKPIYDPFAKGSDKISERKGCVVIYEKPIYNSYNKIYPDQYFYVHDPYVSDTGLSLQSTYVIMNPKYIPEGYSGNCIVASYIGKPETLDECNETIEKLLHYYGNCTRMFWYEANRGDNIRSHMLKKNKQYVLCLRPQLAQGKSMYSRNVRDNGYMMGNLDSKLMLIQKFYDWLLEVTVIDGVAKMNIERIPCLYLIRQIQMYNLDDNFDGVSSMLGYSLGLQETTMMNLNEALNKNKVNKLSFLSQNKFLTKEQDETQRYLEKWKKMIPNQ